jgi:TPR repeat protein
MLQLLRALISRWNTKRTLKSYIQLATQALYSEEFDLNAVVQRISDNDRSINLTLAYIAAKVAADLNEPMSNADVDRAIAEMNALLKHVHTSTLGIEIRKLKESAEGSWAQRRATILEGKRAFELDEWSYAAMIYRVEEAKRRPCSSSEREKTKKAHDDQVALKRQLVDGERRLTELQLEEEASLDPDDLDYRLRCVVDPIDVYGVAMMSYHGDECEQDLVEAAYLCRIAAERGLAMAQHALALMYENGEGVCKDATEAVKWYRKAAEQGYANSLNNLGGCYEDGKGVKQDHAEAVKCYLLAADRGLATAQSYIAGCFARGDVVQLDHKQAFEWYRKAAEQGLAEAQCKLAISYQRGWGVPKDPVLAAKWYQRSADQGDTKAQYYLGLCYQRGEGVQQDHTTAVSWIRRSAEQGDSSAQDYLGDLYEQGQGS